MYGARLGEIPEVNDAYEAILKRENINVSHFDLSDIFHRSEDVTIAFESKLTFDTFSYLNFDGTDSPPPKKNKRIWAMFRAV